MPQFSCHYLNIVLFAYSGGGVEVKEEEEQVEMWEAGKYKCSKSIEAFWHCCGGTRAHSSWLHVVTSMAHAHSLAGWLLHYSDGACVEPSWVSVAFYHYCY
jgi:hypothetical protein